MNARAERRIVLVRFIARVARERPQALARVNPVDILGNVDKEILGGGCHPAVVSSWALFRFVIRLVFTMLRNLLRTCFGAVDPKGRNLQNVPTPLTRRHRQILDVRVFLFCPFWCLSYMF